MKKLALTTMLFVAVWSRFASEPLLAADLCALTWTADPGMRVIGPSGCVHPTFVMGRPDGKYGMYFYDGNGWTFGDTGYATSTDGMNWTYEGRIMTDGGNGFDNINAVITSIIELPGGRLRAYCDGMRSNQVPVKTSIFYTETDDSYGVTWSGSRSLVFPEEESIGCPRIYATGTVYTMYFYSGNDIVIATSANGIDNWSSRQVVVAGAANAFDIVSCPGGDLRMFVGKDGSIKSLSSSDGTAWTWDIGSRLTPDLYGQTSLGTPVLADISGVAKMYIFASPDRQGVYSATATSILVQATLYIDPDTLNLKSKGKWITCYIELPEGYDVGDIDVGSILLETVLGVEHSDVQDGVLMVKFDRDDLIFYLESVLGIQTPDDVTLMVTGELTDGTFFDGSDTIKVINPGG